MASICLFEDAATNLLEPFHQYYPAWDLLCGTASLGQLLPRLYPDSRYLGVSNGKKVSDDVKSSAELIEASQLPQEKILFINSRVVDPWQLIEQVSFEGDDEVYVDGEAVVAMRCTLSQSITNWEEFVGQCKSNLPNKTISVKMAKFIWDYIYANGERIKQDSSKLTLGSIQGVVHERATLIEDQQIAIGEGSTVAPGAVLDATKGPIIMGKNVKIGANSVLLGPLFLGDAVTVNPLAYIRPDTSLADKCKVGGEVSASIMMADSNKQHFGYLGKSYVGSWCNLAAGSCTSNLKNTYGKVSVELTHGTQETQYDSLGAFISHHTKLGGLASLSPGAVVGCFSNVMGATAPKYLPALSWYDNGELLHFDSKKAAEIASRVMTRHQREFSTAHQAVLDSLTA